MLSLSVKNEIQTQIVEPSVKDEIETAQINKAWWRKMASLNDSASQVFVCISTVLSFASGYYNSTHLGFTAGCTGTVALALKQFGVYSSKRSNENQANYERLLIKYKIPEPLESEEKKEEISENSLQISSIAPNNDSSHPNYRRDSISSISIATV